MTFFDSMTTWAMSIPCLEFLRECGLTHLDFLYETIWKSKEVYSLAWAVTKRKIPQEICLTISYLVSHMVRACVSRRKGLHHLCPLLVGLQVMTFVILFNGVYSCSKL